MNMILKVKDRVRHRDAGIDNKQGVMTILEIKNGYAFCSSLDYNNFGTIKGTYPLKDLKLSED